ncbi:hypothetical protein LOAG_01235 [Loa loa]|uniref:Uncharacterized protein n=1 Tax=Loa loa TaxID=7209 RepID=A0A1S0U9W2_LOALO|nr:hypothetical protein LOAG_01235 [Loa loa]EFO27253.1 hypothetical protein LOAG_01235 [Loa loa]
MSSMMCCDAVSSAVEILAMTKILITFHPSCHHDTRKRGQLFSGTISKTKLTLTNKSVTSIDYLIGKKRGRKKEREREKEMNDEAYKAFRYTTLLRNIVKCDIFDYAHLNCKISGKCERILTELLMRVRHVCGLHEMSLAIDESDISNCNIHIIPVSSLPIYVCGEINNKPCG